MRQYQFKTISPQFNRMPPVQQRNFPVPNLPVQQVGFTYSRQQQVVANPIQARSPQPVKTLPPPMSGPSTNSSPDLLNLPNMRKQLQNLLKQTQFLESKSTQNNFSYTTTQTRLNNTITLDKSAKVQSNKAPVRFERQQNFQNYSDRPQNNTQRFSHPIQPNTSFGYVNNVNTSFSNQSIGSPKNQFKANTNYSQIHIENKQLTKPLSQETKYNVDISPSYTKAPSANQNFGQTYQKSPNNARIQNPQKSFNYEQNFTSQKQISQATWASSKQYENKVSSYDSIYSPTNKQTSSKTNIQLNFSLKDQEVPVKPKPQPVPSALEQQLKSENKILLSIQKSQTQKVLQLEKKILSLEKQSVDLLQNIKSFKLNEQLYKIQKKEYEQKLKQVQKQNQEKIKQVRSHLQIQIQHLKVLSNQTKKNSQAEIKNIKESYQKTINQLNIEIQKRQQKIIDLVKQIKSYDEQKSSPQKSLTPQQIQALQSEQIQKLKTELEKKQVDIKNLQNQLKSREQHIQLLNQTFLQLKNQIQDLKIFKKSVETEHYSNFDQILITQMHTINQLKQNMQAMNDKSNQLRLGLIQSQRKNQALQNQIKIMQLKHRSQLSSLNTQAQIQIGHRDNQIGTLNKKMQTLEEKLKFAVNQVKRKDDFVKQYLVGRAESVQVKEHIEQVLSKYQQALSETSEAQLRSELQKAHKQIELYQKYA